MCRSECGLAAGTTTRRTSRGAPIIPSRSPRHRSTRQYPRLLRVVGPGDEDVPNRCVPCDAASGGGGMRLFADHSPTQISPRGVDRTTFLTPDGPGSTATGQASWSSQLRSRSASPVSSRRMISTPSFEPIPSAWLGWVVLAPHSMKKGSRGSPTAQSTPASLHVKTSPLGVARAPS